MEQWNEIFKGYIPQGNYSVSILSGEEKGLVIKLVDGETVIHLNFGLVQAFRVVEEGLVQTQLYFNKELSNYSSNNFQNVIYELVGGQFGQQMEDVSLGYSKIINMRHFLLITQNYNIDILSEGLPEIIVKNYDTDENDDDEEVFGF